MAVTAKRVSLIRRAWASPEHGDGRGLAASLLGVDERTPLRFTRSEVAPCGSSAAHTHSEDLAICVTRGTLTVWLGKSFGERVDVAPGDYVLVPAMVPHRESAGAQGADMIAAHLEAFDTADIE
jgi:quercetin dioxygenase-like cupin family protein